MQVPMAARAAKTPPKAAHYAGDGFCSALAVEQKMENARVEVENELAATSST